MTADTYEQFSEFNSEPVIRRAWRGLTVRTLIGMAILTLLVLTSSGIAIEYFSSLKRSFDFVANEQIGAINTAAELRQRAETITSLAPVLYAKGLEQDALLDFSVLSFKEQSKLQELIEKLKVQTNESLTELEDAKTALFENLDTLATTLYDRAATEAALTEQLRLLFKSAPADAHQYDRLHALLDNVANGTIGLMAAPTLEAFDAIAVRLQADLPQAEDESAGKILTILSGPQGIIVQKRRLFELRDDVRVQLDQNEHLSARLIDAAIVSHGVV